MRYTFNDILEPKVYESTAVMFVFGQYETFNAMVVDTLKNKCVVKGIDSSSIDSAFGIGGETLGFATNAVDFNTFLEVVGVASISGKWFCRVELGSLSDKQKDKLMHYIKEPSNNGVLVITSIDFKEFRPFLKLKVFGVSQNVHLLSLSFPKRNIVKSIVAKKFEENNMIIAKDALDYFVMRMSSEYDDYDTVINSISDNHNTNNDTNGTKEYHTITLQELKDDMSGIENFNLNDFLIELTKPLSNGNTNKKKIIKMLASLEEQLGTVELYKNTMRFIDECIDFRIMINRGIIPIRIDYFMSDVIKMINKTTPEEKREDDEKYKKYTSMNEWQFKNKATIAAQTSLRDWIYMKMILKTAYKDGEKGKNETNMIKALYALATRSVLGASRITNIIGIDDILRTDLNYIDSLKYIDRTQG